jgi:formamidase
MARHEIRIDRSKTLADEPGLGHNRWHPDIPPVLTVEPGDEVLMETRDGGDLQITRDSSLDDVSGLDLNAIHPLTGPVYVNDAEPGDLLVVDILEVTPSNFGFTLAMPGFGALRDIFAEPFLAKWEQTAEGAVCDEIPGVRIPGAPFMGVMGVAPSHDLLHRTIERENNLLAAGGMLLPPSADGAITRNEAINGEALRTMPPREYGGNFDTKQMTVGTRVYFPVSTEGALFSAGDGHFAQGSSECCGTAIETSNTLRARFDLRKGFAAERSINDIHYSRSTPATVGHASSRGGYYATTGLCIERDGTNRAEDINLATKNALLNVIDHLVQERGFTRIQAYVIASVGVDVTVDGIAAVPNVVVSAILPNDIFI